jgi:hypothetical protein
MRPPPFFERQTRLHQRRKQGLVRELVAQPAIEALDEGVLHWLESKKPAVIAIRLNIAFSGACCSLPVGWDAAVICGIRQAWGRDEGALIGIWSPLRLHRMHANSI